MDPNMAGHNKSVWRRSRSPGSLENCDRMVIAIAKSSFLKFPSPRVGEDQGEG
jgi:hypothetical protein